MPLAEFNTTTPLPRRIRLRKEAEEAERIARLEVRMEEIVVVALMLCVLAYCVAVYTGMYVSMFLPMRNMIGQAWDLAAFSIAFVKYAPVDRKLRKRAKKPLFAMTAVLAVARWYNPALYPAFYPWQPSTA